MKKNQDAVVNTENVLADTMTEDSKAKQATGALSRRRFIGASVAAASTFMIVPRSVLGGAAYVSPSDKINIAAVGVSGKGATDIRNVAHENIYALCDVDDGSMAKTLAADFAAPFAGKAKKYRDYREMLDQEPEIDAILISTPDHMHAPVAMKAMAMGKHCFVQKPLTHTVAEARAMAKLARENNLVTQMGNQGHAEEGARLINEWVADGILGTVSEVHCWTNRPVWPQGINRPQGSNPVPSNLDWDLWLGAAPHRPYVAEAYHDFNWRGWIDFGCGALGDMGAHIMDHPYWALDLDLPVKIAASSSRWGNSGDHKDSFPVATKVHYQFAAKGNRPALTMSWYDGGLEPPRPLALEDGRRLGAGGGGSLIIGDKNTLMHDVYGDNPQLIPEITHREYRKPAPTMARSPGIYQEWLDAIKDRSKVTTSHFEYAGRLTETMLLGNIAAQLSAKHKTFDYDPVNMRFTNDDEANALLDKTYRDGFGLS